MNEKEVYFYYKNSKRDIVPNEDPKTNELAKAILSKIYKDHKGDLPSEFVKKWPQVKLYSPSNKLEGSKQIILDISDGSYSLKNKLNHLTGKNWTIFTCSWFIFNALPKDLKEERDLGLDIEDHPATFSPTMVENFIKFFTKEGMSVIDPFAGIGSTLVGCKRSKRIGYGIELNPKYHQIIKKRVPEFEKNIFLGDSRNLKKILKGKKFNFSISSPPYWDVLNRSTANFKKMRVKKDLDVNYSESEQDLGNIGSYEKFLGDVCQIYLDLYDFLENESYLVVIVKNVKKGGKFYPLAWDIGKKLGEKYYLKDEKIWIQDKISLAPYGYPNSWAANILHHYCLIFRKEDGK